MPRDPGPGLHGNHADERGMVLVVIAVLAMAFVFGMLSAQGLR